MSAAQGPIGQRRRLGVELRQLREAAGLKIDQVAAYLECSPSRVSRIETGKAIAQVRDARDMLDMYGVETDAQQRERLLVMAKEAQQEGWWTEYEDVLQPDFETYVGLEGDAASLRVYETHLIHGMLQSEEYARAFIHAARWTETADEVERRVAFRMERQGLLSRSPVPLELWAILDEAVLRRPVGGHAVMREQLNHLIKLAALPNVTIQVLPFAKGAHAGMDGLFEILSFPDQTDTDVVYVESAGGTVYMEKPKDTRRNTLVFERLRAEAMDPDQSVRFIDEIAREIT